MIIPSVLLPVNTLSSVVLGLLPSVAGRSLFPPSNSSIMDLAPP